MRGPAWPPSMPGMESSPIALCRRRPPAARGFTAVELMVVIAIAAILATLALPSFNQMIKRRQMSQDINALVDTIYFARSEAVKWGGNIRVSKYKPAGCTAAGSTNADWSCGWQVEFVTAPSPLPAGVTNPLRVVKANEKNDVMVQVGTTLTLNRWGNPNAGASINVQHKSDPNVGQCMSLSSGGRVRLDSACDF